MSMSKCFKYLALLAAIGAAADASAQTAPPPWRLSGSDTLDKIMIDAILGAEAAPNGAGGTILTPGLLTYVAGGSGTAESQNVANVQSLAPMSRNYTSTVLGAAGRVGWLPSARNVVAADAAVIVTRQFPQRVKTIDVASQFDAIQNTNKASANATSPYVPGTANSGYTALVQVILSGTDGSGSFAACANPIRAQAVADFAALNGVSTIDTFYRRDDNSGTTNVFQDKMNVGRFCNGRARGVVGSNTIDPTNPNLNNQDLDPIRRTCKSPGLLNGVERPATRCTWTAPSSGTKVRGEFCTPADNAATPNCNADNTCPCTRGLVVPLSRGDDATALADATVTIASRVAADTTNRSFGYAGREAVRLQQTLGILTNAPFINNTSYSDAVVRLDQYLLARRLYLNFAPTVTSLGSNTVASGGGAPQVAAETTLFNWMTDSSGTLNADGSLGRCNMEPIVKKWGYIPCTADCSLAPATSTICGKVRAETFGANSGNTFPAAASSASACFPDGTGGANTGWSYDALTGAGTKVCCSTGLAAVGGACPAAIPAGGLAALAACSNDADCASLSCLDNLGTGVRQCQ